MAGHAQLQFVMTECSTTQIRLTWPYSFIIKEYMVTVGHNRAATQQNVASGVFDQARHKPDCAATKAG